MILDKLRHSVFRGVRELDYGLALPLIPRLPVFLAHRLSDLRGEISWRLRGEQRGRIEGNLSATYPDWPRVRVRRVGRRYARTLSRDEMESYWFDRPLPFFENLIDAEGLATLSRASQAGKGIVLYTGHIGSTGTCITLLGRLGFPINLVFRDTDEIPGMPSSWYRYARKRVRLLAEACGRPVIHTGKANYFSMRRKLKAGEILIMGIDVVPEYVSRTVEVDFLGRRAHFPDGAARLHRDTGAASLLWHNRWTESRRHSLQIEDISPTLDPEGDLQKDTQTLVAHLEKVIRAYPAEWLMWEALHQFYD